MNERLTHAALHALPTLLVACLVVTASCGDDPPTASSDADTLGDTVLIVGTDLGSEVASGDASPADTAPPDTGGADQGDTAVAEDAQDAGPDADLDADPVDDTAQPTDADPQDVPALPDVDPDAPCTPDCEGKLCGPDGCGGICGYCAYPDICDPDGQCVDFCKPDCDGKFCGPDGCGGTCGSCEEGLECKEDGLCYEPACVPDCSNKYCGPDGCGSTCGECAWPQVCIDWGCGLGPCGTVDADGACEGDILTWCENLTELKTDDCSTYPGYTCAYDPYQNKFSCVEKSACVPQCDGKVCGDDGCGGSCGACATGWACTQGACTPEPGAACANNEIGLCLGDTLWSCSGDKIYPEDCTDFGQHCGWSPADSSYNCVD